MFSRDSGRNRSLRITTLIHTTVITDTSPSTTPAMPKIFPVMSGLGEAYQMAFSGQGIVVVQPSEDSTDRLRIRG